MKKILKRALILLLCAVFFAACGTTEKSATGDSAQGETVAKSDKQAAKEQKKAAKEKEKAEKQKAQDKKKAGKSKEAKSGDYLAPIEAAVAAGEYEEAYTLLSDETVQGQLGSDDVYNIDAGMMKLYSNDLPAASQHLGAVADMHKLNEKYADADKVELSTLLLDPYSQPYVTYDYEDLYSVIFNAVTKLKDPDTSEAAFQDLKKIREMLLAMNQYRAILSEKIDKDMEEGSENETQQNASPESEAEVFADSALANYLALIYNKYNSDKEGDQKNFFYGQMEKAYGQKSYEGQSMPTIAKAELDSVPAGKARLNVLAMMGLMAEKKQKVVDVDTPLAAIEKKIQGVESIAALGVGMDALLGIMTGGLADKTMHAKCTELIDRANTNNAKSCIVTIGDQSLTLELVEDVNAISKSCMAKNNDFDLKRSKFRTTSRWVGAVATYTATVYAANKKSAMLAAGASIAAGKALDIALDKIDEADMADIRGVHYFPAQVQAGAIELNPGTYDVTIKFLDAAGKEIASQTEKSVKVKAGQLNLLEVECLK
ncbi:MAG: hypothetical protein II890_02675 [Spirochaetia bacterium]|nr:hypothetical protein [Spirochaetia bacterium]